MPSVIEHFSRTRVDHTTLQVMADAQQGLGRLIEEEQSVIRHYVRVGTWPHKCVNMFVFEDLQPLTSQIKRAITLSSVIAEDIDRRPMVNVYDAADLSECAVFVNRRLLEQDGAWGDRLSLRALLAHEHGHPLAENKAVQAARALSVEIKEGAPPRKKVIAPILQLLADRLCVHAPQEVFANEIAIRAGFGEALFHLDRDVVEKACLSVTKRPILVESLGRKVANGKLCADQAARLLFVGDLQAHLGFALETAPFLRAGHDRQAEALEAALSRGVWDHLDPAVKRLYEALRDHYRRLTPDLTSAQTEAWAGEAVALLTDALQQKNLRVRFELARTRAVPKRSRGPKSAPMSARDSVPDSDGGTL
ncbi:MAG: hypothetical protein F9K29_10780 [Hyphomicrobiaceae bacterium]|nr:MAG: hypothetical protein F9K29_10780 [Hyphomicrobiaceae bacterium]